MRKARFAPEYGEAEEEHNAELSEALLESAPSAQLPSPFQEAAMVPPLRAAGGVLRDKHGEYRTLYDQRARTTVLVNLAGILERR